MCAWWRWNGQLKGREGWGDLKPHWEGRRKKNASEKDAPAGPTSGTQHKTREKRKLLLYAPHGAERTN